MRKNVYFSITDSLGGAEQLIMNLASHNKSESTILFFRGKSTDYWEINNFKVIYFDDNIFNFLSFFRKKRFYRVFSSHIMMNALLGLLRTSGFLKTDYLICRESTSVFSRYSGVKLLKYKLAYHLGYRSIDLLITQSDEMRERLVLEMPFLEKWLNIRTIPNLFEYPKIPVRGEERDYPYIVTAGRFINEKGFDILIEAFSILKKTHSELKLIILGEGLLRENYECKIRCLGLEGDVILPGFTEDVYPYFKGAKLCVVSSRIEGFPNVLLQMMSQNEKVVSTLCAGGIKDLQGVLTCETNNVKTLYNTMVQALRLDTSLHRKLFDLELKKRTVSNYLQMIDDYLKNEN